MTPPSQKYRTLSFLLTGGVAKTADQLFTFNLRPEEINVTEPSRLAVTQTLGGGFADAYGRGLRTIQLSGHNGWRGGLLQSGEDLYASLKATVYDGYHDRRAACVQNGLNPNQVQLLFTDNLDTIHDSVAPMVFSLRRSRSRPLLMMYSIQLTSLGPANQPLGLLDQIINALSNPLKYIEGALGLSGLASQLASLQNYVTLVTGIVGAVGAGAQQMIGLAVSLFGSIASVANQVSGVFTSTTALLLTAGQQIAVAGANAFQALATATELSALDLLTLGNVAAAFNDAACTLANAFDTAASFPLLSGLQGASTCSSTAGGDPASAFVTGGLNPWESLFVNPTIPITITAQAAAAILTLSADPLNLIGQTSVIAGAMSDIASGVVINAAAVAAAGAST